MSIVLTQSDDLFREAEAENIDRVAPAVFGHRRSEDVVATAAGIGGCVRNADEPTTFGAKGPDIVPDPIGQGLGEIAAQHRRRLEFDRLAIGPHDGAEFDREGDAAAIVAHDRVHTAGQDFAAGEDPGCRRHPSDRPETPLE